MGWLEGKTNGIPNVLVIPAALGGVVLLGVLAFLGTTDEKSRSDDTEVKDAHEEASPAAAASSVPSSAPTTTSSAAHDAGFDVTVGCLEAAKDSIKRLEACGFKAADFSPSQMCRDMGYQKLNVLRSMGCEAIGNMLAAGMQK